jgi:hypothetical protein
MQQAKQADPTMQELQAIREEIAALRILLLEEQLRVTTPESPGSG